MLRLLCKSTETFRDFFFLLYLHNELSCLVDHHHKKQKWVWNQPVSVLQAHLSISLRQYLFFATMADSNITPPISSRTEVLPNNILALSQYLCDLTAQSMYIMQQAFIDNHSTTQIMHTFQTLPYHKAAAANTMRDLCSLLPLCNTQQKELPPIIVTFFSPSAGQKYSLSSVYWIDNSQTTV